MWKCFRKNDNLISCIGTKFIMVRWSYKSLDLYTVEWLEEYLNMQYVPMVIISHRASLNQLCTKIVEIDMGISMTFEGNYFLVHLLKLFLLENLNLCWFNVEDINSPLHDNVEKRKMIMGACTLKIVESPSIFIYFIRIEKISLNH